MTGTRARWQAELEACIEGLSERVLLQARWVVPLLMQMPELTGLDLQRALTESGREEQVIFITGDGDIPICARAMKAGAADFLPEPLAAMQRALVRSGAQQLEKDEQTDARPRIATLTPPGDRWEDEQRNCRGPRDS